MLYNTYKLYHKTEEKIYFILKSKQLQHFMIILSTKETKGKMRLLLSKNKNLELHFNAKFSKKNNKKIGNE